MRCVPDDRVGLDLDEERRARSAPRPPGTDDFPPDRESVRDKTTETQEKAWHS
jgi:hypothetical protein